MLPVRRTCAAIAKSGGQCSATPMAEGAYCFWHDPEHAEAAAQARRLGGVRRRREGTVAGTFGIEGLETVADLRRLLHIVVTDTLALENGVQRARTLIAAIQVGAKLLEVGEIEDRVASLEDVMGPRLKEKGR